MVSLGPMSQGFTTQGGWFVDAAGRHTLLRGVNLGGSTKVPATPDGSTHLGVDFENWADVSFVGRPFPLADADRHLDRLAHWGFNCLRFLVTWEAIEHAGPGEYDEAYLDFVRAVIVKAGERGMWVFVDPHHDVWSRWTGGDGAPFWCFDGTGLLPERFVAAGAVSLDAHDWPANYRQVPVAHMWTLFFAGDTFLPEAAGAQERLQDHYIGAVAAVAERLAGLGCVLGYDTLNEPSGGFVGRSAADLATGIRFFGEGPPPPSTLEYLAAADGHTVEVAGGALNPGGVSVWAGGCPWRRAGVWDLDASGRPVLTAPEHFTHVDGRAVSAWADYMVPFVRRFRERLRAVHPGCVMFVEGSPMDFLTPWDDPDPLVVNARHWYDVVTLHTRRFDPGAYHGPSGKPRAGAAEVAEEFVVQLGTMARYNRDEMGNPPLLVGEFGIPYEMNGGEAFSTGDYSAHEVLLDANYRAMEALLLNSTQWNYTAGNTHAHGEGWNHEDLSIFCLDEIPRHPGGPGDVDAGGRTIDAFSRPYVRHAAGRPTLMSFDPTSGDFALDVDADPAVAAPTVVFVPARHYPAGPQVEVSAGTTDFDAAAQVLTWDHGGATGGVSLRLRR